MDKIKFIAEQDKEFPEITNFLARQIKDDRGQFEEWFNSDFFHKDIHQISHSISHKNVFRGLHYQPGMGKFIRVLKGKATIFSVDIREGFNFKTHQWSMVAEIGETLYTPWYYAKGIFSHQDNTEVLYYQTDTVNDEAKEIHFSVSPVITKFLKRYKKVILSDKDQNAPISL